MRRRRIKAAPDIAFRHAGGAMAHRAMCRIVLDADQDLRRIMKLGRCLDAESMGLDRAGSHRVENPARYWPMRLAGGDIKHTRVDEGEPANNDEGYQEGERDQEATHPTALRTRRGRRRRSGSLPCSHPFAARKSPSARIFPDRRRRYRARISG